MHGKTTILLHTKPCLIKEVVSNFILRYQDPLFWDNIWLGFIWMMVNLGFSLLQNNILDEYFDCITTHTSKNVLTLVNSVLGPWWIALTKSITKAKTRKGSKRSLRHDDGGTTKDLVYKEHRFYSIKDQKNMVFAWTKPPQGIDNSVLLYM